jgi:hypothetical protein
VLDYLPIQALAIPCEWVFSLSGETDTKWQNRIHPILMEALQMLKFLLKQQRLNFTEGWLTSECDMLDTVDDSLDLLAALLNGAANGIDDVIAAISQGDEDA